MYCLNIACTDFTSLTIHVSLQVLVRTESKFGRYICRASNKFGYMEHSLLLHKGQKPATPTLEQVVVGKNAAKIRVVEGQKSRSGDPARDRERNPGKFLPNTGYFVQYKMMTRGDWITANISLYDDGKLTMLILY